MDFEKLRVPLSIDDIDFRVQSVNKGWYATILAYKDARVDMKRLDDVCWPMGWKREHFDQNTKCRVSIWDDSKNEWVSKEDIGTESATEKEKWLASDSFKRACFNWGIGRELYDYPIMQIKLNSDEFDKATSKATYNFKLKEWKWENKFKDGKLIELIWRDEKGFVRFSYPNADNNVNPHTNKKALFSLKEFKKVAQAFIDWGVELARWTAEDLKNDYLFPDFVNKKLANMWEYYKANNGITIEDAERIYKQFD